MSQSFHVTRFLLAAALVTASLAPSGAQAEAEWYDGRWPHEHHALTPHPQAIFGRLDNGFRYVILPNAKPSARVHLALDVQVGSLMEADAEAGIAHYLEHMAFNGSRHFPPGTLIPFLQEHGMRFGGDANAHTSAAETVYELNLAPQSPADLGKGLLVLRDVADGLTLDAEEVDKERGVILSEKSARDSERSRLAQQRRALMFAGTKFVTETIGTEATIAAVDAASLRHFYDLWYRPERMILVAVGDIDPEALRRLIESRFADLRPRSEAVAVQAWGDVSIKGVVARHDHTAVAGFSVAVSALQPRLRRPDDLAEQRRQLVGMIAREMFQRRLQAESGGNGPFINANHGTAQSFNLFPTASLSASCKSDQAEICVKALGQQLGSALAFGFSDEEFAAALVFQRTRIDALLSQAAQRSSTEIATEIVFAMNNDQVFQSEEQARAVLLPMFDHIDKAETEAVFHETWNSGNRVITSSGNVDLGPDPSATLIAAWQAGESQNTAPQPLAADIRFPYLPEPGHTLDTVAATSRTLPDSALTERRIELSNGLVLRLLPTPFDRGKLNLSLLFGPGLDALSERDHAVALTTGHVLRTSGLGRLDREAYRHTLAARQIRVEESYGGDAFAITASGATADQDLLLTALWTQFSDPHPREEERQRLQESLKIGRNDRLNTLDGVTPTAVERFLFSGAKRSRELEAETVATVPVADMTAFLARSRQQGPRTLVVVGDFDPDSLADQAARLFAAVPAPAAPVVAENRPQPAFPAGQTQRVEVGGLSDKAVLVMAWRSDTTDEANPRRLATQRLLAAVLNDRLRDRVREKMGASYSPSARYRYDSDFAGYGFFTLTVTTERANVERVRVAAIEEARALATKALPAGMAERVRATALTGVDSARQQNRYWQRLIEQESRRGLPIATWTAQQTNALREVSAAEIEQAAAALAAEPAQIIVEEQPAKVTAR